MGWARGVPRWARTVALIPGGQGAGVPVDSRRRLCAWGARNMELRWVTPRFDVSPTDFRAPLSLVLSCVHSLRRHVLPQIGLHRFPPCKFLIVPFSTTLFFFTTFCPRLCLPQDRALIKFAFDLMDQDKSVRSGFPQEKCLATSPPKLLVNPRHHRGFIPFITHRLSTFSYLRLPPTGKPRDGRGQRAVPHAVRHERARRPYDYCIPLLPPLRAIARNCVAPQTLRHIRLSTTCHIPVVLRPA